MSAKLASHSPGALLARLFRFDRHNITAATAKYFLSIGFDEADKARMQELATKNQAGRASLDEREELFSYIDLCDLLTVLHSKSRQVLKKSNKKSSLRR